MLSLRIAFRYLISKKRHNAVNVISAISMTGVAVATAAIVVVLSVFNGFGLLSERQLSRIDADLRVTPAKGKVIEAADSIASAIAGLPEIKAASSVIEERAMLITHYGQMPVVMKAVGPDYTNVSGVDSLIIDGVYAESEGEVAAMQISVGVANRTGERPSPESIGRLCTPRRTGRINPANPTAAFRQEDMIISGVFQTDNAETDNDHVIVPLATGRRLLEYDDEASAIDIAVRAGVDISRTKAVIENMLGEDYTVMTRAQQQEDTFKMIEVEKWVTFMMLTLILVIASFNIISTMSLLVAEKREDMETIRAIGGSRRFISRIFMFQGFLVTAAGGAAGIIAGVVLALLQEHFGLIKLSGDPEALTIDAYPVAVSSTDILIVAAALVAVALLTSQITRFFTKNID